MRPFGYLLRSRVFRSGDTIPLRRITLPRLETELCFRLGARLVGPDIEVRQVRNALASVAPAFEINEDRIDGPEDPGLRIADNLRQWGIVRGEELKPVPETFGWDALVSTIMHDGRLLESVLARGHIDDHFRSIAVLVRELSKFERALEADDFVTTESFTRQAIHRIGRFEGTFADIGSVTVTFQ